MNKFVLSEDDFIKPTIVNFQDNIDIIEGSNEEDNEEVIGGNMLEVIEEKGDDKKNYIDQPIVIKNINNIIVKNKIDEDFEIEYSESESVKEDDDEFRIEYDDEDLLKVEKSTYEPADNVIVGGEYSDSNDIKSIPDDDVIVEDDVESVSDDDVIVGSDIDDEIVGGNDETLESIIGNYISELDLQEI